MDIVIRHCNNLDEATLSILSDRLNVKYGPNGTGKSTIARVLDLRTKGADGILALRPFKYRNENAPNAPTPSVVGADAFHSVMAFNEDYVNQFVFKQDEIIKNSFDIFIKTPEYEKKMKEIEDLVAEIRTTFNESKDIDEVARDLTELSESFGKSNTGFSKAGRIGKGLGNGNKIAHIPAKLTPYSSFIRSPINVKWIKWQIEGNEYLKISEDCPYCTTPTSDKKDTILAVSQEYDAKSIEHLVALQGILGRLGAYFSGQTLQNINAIVRTQTGLKKEEITYLIGIKNEIDTLREKLADAKSLSFFSLRDVSKVEQTIKELKIDLSLLPCLLSEETKTIVGKVNNCLDTVLLKAGKLQGEINRQKKGIEATTRKYRDEINTFLRYAGYRYTVDVQPEGTSYKMKLRHEDYEAFIESGSLHLSYGEKNAFALVLFMYECLTRRPNLVVLDDPISSFDKTKKFAILEMLFRGKESLQGKTVLMLTHDIEPVIDLVKNLAHTFQPLPIAHFLKLEHGKLTELSITREEVLSFSQICTENLTHLTEDALKLVYLRRQYELLDDKGCEYELLSNLLHKRDVPIVAREGGRPMGQNEIAEGTTALRNRFANFDYATLLAKLNDDKAMLNAYESASSNYEKLQLFRIICAKKHPNDVVMKYINETYHIENEYVMQLNPHKFDFVPQHIVRECNSFLNTA